MKNLIVGIYLLLACCSVSAQNAPDWVKQRPANSLYYIGIGHASKSDKDYTQVARQNALRDLASEIKVEIKSTSLLHMLEAEEKVSSNYEETIRVSVSENIENYHMADSWQDDKDYWVFYELSILDYQQYVKKRREKAISEGYDFWKKGQTAMDSGELITALELWLKGLQAIQPAVQDELIAEYDGERVDVANELYNAVKTIFNGVTVTPSEREVSVKAFQKLKDPVVIHLQKGEVALKNVPLQWKFVTGNGQLSRQTNTDNLGNASLYIDNVISTIPRQEIRVRVDESALGILKNGVFSNLIKEMGTVIPQASVYANVIHDNLRAYIRTGNNEDPAVQKAVRSLLTKNYFTLVDNLSAADLCVDLTTEFQKGDRERVGMSAMRAYYASATVKITRLKGSEVVLDYSLDEVKVLQPETVSEKNSKNAMIKELQKRLNRELPERLKQMYAE